MNQGIREVKHFWEENPLFTGETQHPAGSREFFEEHNRVYIQDCFAGAMDERILPTGERKGKVLDLGCGPGFWTVLLARRGCREVVGADLTRSALELARKRCEIFEVEADFAEENAEHLSFPDGVFSHVNCLGVIHHTPDTEACVREIARVLEPGGSACLSVYYRNLVLRAWPVFRFFGKILHKMGGRLKGRGREDIFALSDTDEIVRLYDGKDNPIGKCYSKKQFRELLELHFEIDAVFFHFFPARTLPARIPKLLHRFLDRFCPFMIYATLRKR